MDRARRRRLRINKTKNTIMVLLYIAWVALSLIIHEQYDGRAAALYNMGSGSFAVAILLYDDMCRRHLSKKKNGNKPVQREGENS